MSRVARATAGAWWTSQPLRLSTSALLAAAGLALDEESEMGWTEVQTAHVTLKSDLPPAEKRCSELTSDAPPSPSASSLARRP